jgi:N-carbamoyl-L-amino-acid hydrolase
VPNGGPYDGALGVVSGLEVLQTLKDARLPLKLNLEVVDFTDEEGAFLGLLGSRALAGTLEREHLRTPRGDRSAFETALTQTKLTEESILGAQRDPHSLAGYLELHVEQGGRLIDAGLKLGLVTGIVGVRSFKMGFLGHANHAGTTPMNERLDAAQGASAFTLAARKLVLENFPESVVNVGNMSFEPGAFNIVPERVTLELEFRSDTMPKLDALEACLLENAEREAERFGLNIDIKPVGKVPPAPMADKIQAAFMEASQTLNVQSMKMVSGAGHDAQSLAAVCPTGMIFIPSIGGISHSPKEFSRWEDCVNGANVLLQAVLKLAS